MSIKIYNGIRFCAGVTIEDISQWADDIRPVVQEKAHNDIVEMLLRCSIHEFDKMTLEGCHWATAKKSMDTSAVGRVLDDARATLKHENNDKWDSVQVFLHKGRIYGFLDVGRDLIRDLRQNHEGTLFDDYSYWNNSDMPEDLTLNDWKEREVVWEGIMKDAWSIEEVGMRILLSKHQAFERSLYRFVDDFRDKPNPEVIAAFFNKINMTPLERAKRLFDSIENATWAQGQGQPVMAYLKDIQNDNIPAFVEAYHFLAAHVLEPIITAPLLFASMESLKNKHKALLETIWAQNVPQSLLTPTFEREYLSFHLKDNRSGAALTFKKM